MVSMKYIYAKLADERLERAFIPNIGTVQDGKSRIVVTDDGGVHLINEKDVVRYGLPELTRLEKAWIDYLSQCAEGKPLQTEEEYLELVIKQRKRLQGEDTLRSPKVVENQVSKEIRNTGYWFSIHRENVRGSLGMMGTFERSMRMTDEAYLMDAKARMLGPQYYESQGYQEVLLKLFGGVGVLEIDVPGVHERVEMANGLMIHSITIVYPILLTKLGTEIFLEDIKSVMSRKRGN